MAEPITLAVEPQVQRFGAAQEEAFAQCLRDTNAHTVPYPIMSLDDVTLGPSGRTRRGDFQLTTTALSQLCGSVAPGLCQAVSSLSGLRRREDEESDCDAFDPQAAIDAMNIFIKSRFTGHLSGKQLIRNTRTGTIDGVVGPKYQYLANADLYQRTKEIAARSDVPARFHEAILAGRRVAIRYRGVEELFQIPAERETSEPFFGGFHFGNSEVGDCAVHAGMIIIRQWCDNTAVGSFQDSSRLVHAGNQFGARLEHLLDRVRRRSLETGKLKSQVLELIHTPLGLGGTLSDEEHQNRSDDIVDRLARRGMTQTVARRALMRALVEGSFGVSKAGTHGAPQREIWARRTAYDLFNGITSEAKSLALYDQERTEQVGYDLLIGKISLN